MTKAKVDPSDGVWLDTKTNEVTTTRPSEAIQLVAPGGAVPDNVRRLIDGDEETRTETEPVDDDDGGADKTVTTTGTAQRRGAAKK